MSDVQFWFEFASTYSYLAAMRIEQVAAEAGVPIVWRPFLLGPLFKRQGWNDSPFNIYPARGRYMLRDIERRCAAYGIPFRRPTQFPRHSLLAARVACAAQEEPWLPEFARRVYTANFGEDRDISERPLITSILDSLGLDGSGLVARTAEPACKERLRLQTEQAWESGVFGAPTFIVDSEIFWGNDLMEEALEWHRKGAAGGNPSPF